MVPSLVGRVLESVLEQRRQYRGGEEVRVPPSTWTTKTTLAHAARHGVAAAGADDSAQLMRFRSLRPKDVYTPIINQAEVAAIRSFILMIAVAPLPPAEPNPSLVPKFPYLTLSERLTRFWP